MILSLKIAIQFHRSCKKNILISLVSIISIISITIGIIISIVSLSVMNGFENELDKRILSIIPHIEIIPINIPFDNWKITLNKIKNISNIIDINPYINFSGVVEFNNKWHALYVKSINLLENYTPHGNDYRFINFIEKKSWKYFCEHKNQIILGKGVSDSLNVKIGDWITILFTHDVISRDKLLSINKTRVQVSGVLNLKSQLDENLAIISLSDAQAYCNNRLDIDGIAITVKNAFCINHIIKEIKKKLDTNIIIRSWMDTYGYIYQDIQMVRLIIYLSIILIMGISCFNVITALMLCIKKKYYDIAILKALGASNILIQRIFLWYGFIIYFISSIIGVNLGVLITLNLSNINIISIKIFNNTILPKGVYFIDFIPIYFDKWSIYYILSTVLLLGLLISWYISFKTRAIHLAQILK